MLSWILFGGFRACVACYRSHILSLFKPSAKLFCPTLSLGLRYQKNLFSEIVGLNENLDVGMPFFKPSDMIYTCIQMNYR